MLMEHRGANKAVDFNGILFI